MLTTLKVFSLFVNVKYIVEKNKDLKYLNKVQSNTLYQRQKQFVKDKCESMAVLVNNQHFTLKDYIIFLFDSYFFHDKLEWNNIKKDNILKCKKAYTEKELKKSQDLILELKNSIKLFKNLDDLYRLDPMDGSNILLELIKDDKITTYFYVKYYLKVSEKNLENCSNKIQTIHKNCLYLYKLLNRHFECTYIKE